MVNASADWPIKVVFFATPTIALKTFEELTNDENFDVQAFVTQAPKPSGRGKKITEPPLKSFAIKNNIKTFEPFKISIQPDIINELKNFKPDFFVTFAFGQILSQEVLDIPQFGTINLHASLLPLYRGANPIRQAILDGVTKTGVTTMLTALELDAGDICLQDEIKLNEDMNSIDLMNEIAEISPNLIKKTLIGIKNGTIVPTKQKHEIATFTKKSKKEDKIIDWNESAQKIHNKVRALVDHFTCQTTFNGKIIKILKTKKTDIKGDTGAVLEVSKHGIMVGCGEDSLLIELVKPEGKSEMTAYNWSLGARLKAGDRFE